MTHPRDEVCRAIASLSSSCSVAEVETVLEPLFQSYRAPYEDMHHYRTEGIAPLIVACDKGNVSCLQYLWVKVETSKTSSSWISNFIGKPLDQSPDHGNSAMHHAAMAGCHQAIAILAQMEQSSSPVWTLGTVRNTHGDTPLMMAAAAGHVHFCRTWQELCCQDNDKNTNSSCPPTDVRNAWKLKNDSNDSCLSLACARGHCDVVEFLLSSACGVSPDSQEITQGQILSQKMLAARRLPSLTQVHRDQLERVQVCIEMLQVATTQVAEQAAQELLGSEFELESKGGGRVQGKIKAKSKKSKASKGRQPTTLTLSSNETTESNKDTPVATEQSDVVEVMTLSDGKRAVRVAGDVESTELNCNLQPTVSANVRPPRSADDLFRERFQQSRICSEVDSVMQALCLETSMLLYTPHGMAIHLSPSQLDAIQDILEKQLHAVHEARTIQQRLHKT